MGSKHSLCLLVKMQKIDSRDASKKKYTIITRKLGSLSAHTRKYKDYITTDEDEFSYLSTLSFLLFSETGSL